MAEPIIIHGTSDGITITNGSAVLKIEPSPGKKPFGRVLVRRKNETDEKKHNTFSLEEDWDITIESFPPDEPQS